MVLEQVFAVSGVERPDRRRWPASAAAPAATGCTPRRSSRLLAEMQVVARAHPMGRW